MRLQSQREGIEARTNRILDHFRKLKLKINEWESSSGDFPTSSAKIHQKYNLLFKTFTELSNQALLATVSIVIHREILNLENILAQIKRHGLKRVDSRIDGPIENSAPYEINLSVIIPPCGREQKG